MLAIIDYSAGNLANVRNALERLGHAAQITADPHVVAQADGVILPGVGAFASAARVLRQTGLDEALTDFRERGRPLLGICLGMQLFFATSEEGPGERGFGFLSGQVRRLEPPQKIPHMGWNLVSFTNSHPFFDGTLPQGYLYFAHSYCAEGVDKATVAATCTYGKTLTAAVAKDNLVGMQFHPEKSGPLGLGLLDQFAQWAKGGRDLCC